MAVALVLAAAVAVAGYVFTRDPDPVRAVYPPDPSSISPPGTEKFIVFSYRDEPGSARIWEFVPRDPGQGLALRCEFYDKVAGALPMPAEVPGLVSVYIGDLRLRQDGSLIRSLGSLLGLKDNNTDRWIPLLIDYRFWRVSPVGSFGMRDDPSPTVHVAGPRFFIGTEKRVYGFHPDGRAAGTLDMQVIRDFGWCWLIRRPDDLPDTGHLFDPVADRIVVSFNMDAYNDLVRDKNGKPRWPREMLLSRQGKYVAGCEFVTRFSQQGGPKPGYPLIAFPATLRASDIRNGPLHEFPVNLIQCPYGYQENIGFYWRFIDEEKLVYSSAAQIGDQTYDYMDPTELANHMEEVTADLATGQVTRRPVPVSDLTPIPFHSRAFPFLPAYLIAAGAVHTYNELIAEMFLHVSGLSVKLDKNCGVLSAAFSSDGRRFLCKTKPQVLSGDFFYGDLETREWKRIPAPAPHLTGKVGTEIVWVRIP